MLLLTSVAFVAIGAFIFLDSEKVLARWLGWTWIGTFVLTSSIFLWQIFDSRPRLILDEDGVIDRTLGVGKIFWKDIKGLSVKTVYKNDFVCLQMDEDSNQRYLSNLSPIKRKLVAASVAFGWPPLILDLRSLNGSAEEIFQALVQQIEKVNNGSSA